MRLLIRSTVIALSALTALAGPAAVRAQAAENPFPRARPEDVGMSSARLRETMDSVRGWVQRDAIRGAILIVIRNGKLVLQDTAGWSDMERGLRMRADQIVTMRSMTKPFVATAALMLMQEGKLRLDDPVAKYLPAFDNAKSREITIQQLLTHTSGIRGEVYNDQNGAGTPFHDLREAADSVGKLGPETVPGTAYWYSDPGYSVLGAVVAVASGMSCEAFIQRRIFDPLGMHDSFLAPPSASNPKLARFSATYHRDSLARKWVRYWDNTMPPAVPFFRASGGLYASGMDYARFLAMMLDHGRFGSRRLLDSASVAVALQPYEAAVLTPEQVASRDSFYGLGWIVYSDRYHPVHAPFTSGIFEHSGSDGTQAWVDPSKGLILVYLTQSRAARTSRQVVRMVYDAFTGAAIGR